VRTALEMLIGAVCLVPIWAIDRLAKLVDQKYHNHIVWNLMLVIVSLGVIAMLVWVLGYATLALFHL
jgi:small-conductance mechanosensitive channel